ncbi:MAG: hypothetical protein H7Z71_09825 [Moraxellaceae bacterium]|nr:hypothetical protein [Pseudobdellovibrionaceae bacterium]
MRKFVSLLVLLSSLSVGAVEATEKKVVHPGARKDGLTRIDSEGNYIYEVEDELRNQSMNIRLGYVMNPQISVAITKVGTSDVTVVNFDDMYDGAEKLSIGFDYEYFFTNSFGRIGLQTGLAFQYAEGNGRLASDPNKTSIEKFTFVTMPLFLGLTYRFEYHDRQYFAPYVAGGGVYTLLAEKRDDDPKIKAIGSFGYYAAGGGLLNVTAFSREMSAEFRTEYDISNIWINLEFRTVQVQAASFTYENSFIQGGVTFDF